MDQYPILTAQLLQQPGEVALYEAGFHYNGVLVLADVVHKHPDGTIHIYEVKNSTAISDTFRNDVAIQHYVIHHALEQIAHPDLFSKGLTLAHFYLLYNDGEDGFVQEDILPFAQSQHDTIHHNIARFKEVLRATEPQIPMSPHCDNPYECPYKHYCKRQHPTEKEK